MRCDLQEVYGVDLAEYVRDRRWRALLDLIDGLPAASRTREAVLNDPEQARIIADLPEPDEPWAPQIRDWDLHNLIGARQLDALNQLIAVVVGMRGGSVSEPKPFPDPVTALVREKRDRLERKYRDLIAEFGF